MNYEINGQHKEDNKIVIVLSQVMNTEGLIMQSRDWSDVMKLKKKENSFWLV